MFAQFARTFSDIQICTGLAILISGFNAFSCGIQSYHWHLIIYLAWLALITHASLLSLLRNYLLNHRQQLWWRFTGMFAILIMFIVAVSITPNFEWTNRQQLTHYAQCAAIGVAGDSGSIESKLKMIFFVAYGYVIRSLKLFKTFDQAPQRLSSRLRRKATSIQHGITGSHGRDSFEHSSFMVKLKMMVVDTFQIMLYRVLHLHLDLLTSFLAEVR